MASNSSSSSSPATMTSPTGSRTVGVRRVGSNETFNRAFRRILLEAHDDDRPPLELGGSIISNGESSNGGSDGGVPLNGNEAGFESIMLPMGTYHTRPRRQNWSDEGEDVEDVPASISLRSLVSEETSSESTASHVPVRNSSNRPSNPLSPSYPAPSSLSETPQQPAASSAPEPPWLGRGSSLSISHISEAFSSMMITNAPRNPPKDRSPRATYFIPLCLRLSSVEEAQAELHNPYRRIDLNAGWNRAILKGGEFLNATPDSSQVQIAKDFAGYSLRSQRRLLPVRLSLPPNRDKAKKEAKTEERRLGEKETGRNDGADGEEDAELEKMFRHVFCTTSRPCPPSQSGHTKPLSGTTSPSSNHDDDGESSSSASRVDNVFLQFFQAIHYEPQPSRPLKRKATATSPLGRLSRLKDYLLSYLEERLLNLRENSPRKRGRRPRGGEVHRNETKTKMVVSDAFRKRKQKRESRKGKWADGTLRQNRLWAEFHWVLDGEVGEDPRVQKRAYEDMGRWSWGGLLHYDSSENNVGASGAAAGTHWRYH